MINNHLNLQPFSSFNKKQINEDLSVVLKCMLNMKKQFRRFHHHEILFYLDNLSLFIVKYSLTLPISTFDKQENKRYIRISLPTEKGQTNINKIQIISTDHEGFILIGFANSFSLYRLSTGSLISTFSLPNNQDKILTISEAYQLNKNASYLTVITSSDSYLLRITHIDDLTINLIPLQNASIIGFFSSYFKKPSQLNQYNCFTFNIQHIAGIYSLVLINNTWKLYLHNPIDGTTRKVWQKQLFNLSACKVVDMALNFIKSFKPIIQVLVLVKRNPNDEDLLKIQIDLQNGNMKTITRSMSQDQNTSSQIMVTQNKLYITINDNNTSKLLFLSLDSELALQKQINIEGSLVVGHNIIITETDVYDILQHEHYQHNRYMSEYQHVNLVPQQEHQNEFNYESLVKQFSKVQKPSVRLEKILRYEETDFELIKQQIIMKIQRIDNLMNKSHQLNSKQIYSKCLIQVLLLSIQLKIIQNLNNNTLSKLIQDQTNPQPLSEFFRDTSLVMSTLSSLGKSSSWTYLVQLLNQAIEKYHNYTPKQSFMNFVNKDVSSKFLSPIVDCLNNSKQSQHPNQSQKLLEIGLQLSNQDPKLYDYIFSSQNYRQYYSLCKVHKYDYGIIRLYVETQFMNSQMIKDYINQCNNPRFINQLCEYYFQYINGKRIKTLKLLIDLPEYSQLFYEMTKQQYPQYAWIISLNTDISQPEFRNGLQKVMASGILNSNVIINLQSNGNFDRNINTKLQIVKVCQKLGWNNMTVEQFLNVVQSKSPQQFEVMKRSVQQQGLSLDTLINDCQTLIQQR